MKKNSGYEIVFEGMKKYLSVGMKKTNFCKKKFHTLGYENIGCFSLMRDHGLAGRVAGACSREKAGILGWLRD